jgi:3-hydroxybutyrate dehydrogenase
MTRPDAEMTEDVQMLCGRVALVTGGATGLGRAIVERLAHEGAAVVVLSLGQPRDPGEVKHFANAREIEDLQEVLRRQDCNWVVVEGDVSSEEDVGRAVAAAEDLGGVDILVNNAATNCLHDVEGHDVGTWRRVIDVDLIGPFLTIRACVPGMRKRGFGRIVSIASTNAHVGSAGYSAYCAAKHGLIGLHRAVAEELDGEDITVNTISPGWLDTPSARLHMKHVAAAHGVSADSYKSAEVQRQPQRRIVASEEVAAVVAFLVGPEGRLIHDADIQTSGGAAV